MNQNNLYFVQDSDRPMHVVAESWIQALSKWKQAIANENNMDVEDVTEPKGIEIVCDHGDLIA